MKSGIVRWLCLLCLLVGACSIKNTFSETSSDMYAKYVVNLFGMAVGGKITVDYNVHANNEAQASKSYVLILIFNYDQQQGWYDNVGKNDLSESTITTMCQQPAMLRKRAVGKGSFEFDVTPAIGENRLAMAVLQCYKGDKTNPVSVELTAELLNARPNSQEYSHLPIERVMETRVLEGEMIIYALLFVGMIGQIWAAKYVRSLTLPTSIVVDG
jgi:hypothetical protein